MPLHNPNNQAKPLSRSMKTKKSRRFASLTGVALAVTMLCGTLGALGMVPKANATSSKQQYTTAQETGTIVIGGKNFVESQIMADMLELMVQHFTHMHVIMKSWLDSSITWQAMHANDIDAYVEYTGTGLVNILHQPTTTNPIAAYNTVKRLFQKDYQVTWLKPMGFNDTYALVMKQSEATRLGIHNLSQLATHSGTLIIGADQDFVFRADSLPDLNKTYHTHFKQVVTLSTGLKYQALSDKKVDVTDGFSTDPQIPQLGLYSIIDNKHMFPPYYAAPIIRDSVLRAHPELAGIFNRLAGAINDKQMQKMNELVSINNKNALNVARYYLTVHHIL